MTNVVRFDWANRHLWRPTALKKSELLALAIMSSLAVVVTNKSPIQQAGIIDQRTSLFILQAMVGYPVVRPFVCKQYCDVTGRGA
jgi:hypothetical protein